MIELFGSDVMWIAQRHGQDWRDESVLEAIRWLTSLVPSAEWQPREDKVEDRFQAAKSEWAEGRRIPLHEPRDAIAWYVHQARRYADPALRPDFFLPEGYRIAPLFRRIGQLLPTLRGIGGVDERAARLMTENISQPDDAIYELLVGGAYAVRGWDHVAFVPEAPGREKRPDLYVDRPRSHWAVECKRAGRSGYAREEREVAERMAECVHALSESSGHSFVMLTTFTDELHLLGDHYLGEKAERFLDNDGPLEWNDDGGEGVVFDMLWAPLHKVLEHDDIYFGSSRMVELLLGRYDRRLDFSMGGAWIPAEDRPFHATWVDRASLVVWTSRSAEAARRKAMHFRGLVARAASQLPGDRRGAIHVGYEAVGGNSADSRRHRLNREQMRSFEPGETGLRIVYGNYFTPELVTARNESAAVSETTAWYPVGNGRPLHSLPSHMLFKDEDGLPGSHWR